MDTIWFGARAGSLLYRSPQPLDGSSDWLGSCHPVLGGKDGMIVQLGGMTERNVICYDRMRLWVDRWKKWRKEGEKSNCLIYSQIFQGAIIESWVLKWQLIINQLNMRERRGGEPPMINQGLNEELPFAVWLPNITEPSPRNLPFALQPSRCIQYHTVSWKTAWTQIGITALWREWLRNGGGSQPQRHQGISASLSAASNQRCEIRSTGNFAVSVFSIAGV